MWYFKKQLFFKMHRYKLHFTHFTLDLDLHLGNLHLDAKLSAEYSGKWPTLSYLISGTGWLTTFLCFFVGGSCSSTNVPDSSELSNNLWDCLFSLPFFHTWSGTWLNASYTQEAASHFFLWTLANLQLLRYISQEFTIATSTKWLNDLTGHFLVLTELL